MSRTQKVILGPAIAGTGLIARFKKVNGVYAWDAPFYPLPRPCDHGQEVRKATGQAASLGFDGVYVGTDVHVTPVVRKGAA